MYIEEVNNLTESTVHKFCTSWGPYIEPLLIEPGSILKPVIEEAPKIELKTLHVNLKYVYLDANETFPVIIAANLTSNQ